jgi:pilus assembly protein CpaF
MLPGLEEVKRQIHEKLVARLNLNDLDTMTPETRRMTVRGAVEQLLKHERSVLPRGDRQQLIDELVNEVLGLGPLENLLSDTTVSDILINGPNQVYVERNGVLEQVDVRFRDEGHLLQVIDRIISPTGRHVDPTNPMVDARLDDGSRVNVIVPPLSLRGPAVSIRRFGVVPLKLDDLLRLKMFPPEIAQFLDAAIKLRLNVVVSGGTGSGKTTLLNVLSRFIPSTERIITIEDAAELQLQQPHVVQLQSRPRNIEGKGEVTPHDLLRNALRMRPNRIIIGEVRGPEVVDMLQAMNTGHDGSLATLHANSTRDALSRLELMMLMGGFDWPVRAMRQQIASAIHLVIQTARLQSGARRLVSVAELTGLSSDTITTQELFAYRELGTDEAGRQYGQFEATGVKPTFFSRFKTFGVSVPESLFRKRVLGTD